MSKLTKEERLIHIKKKYTFHSHLIPCTCDGCFLVSELDQLIAENDGLRKDKLDISKSWAEDISKLNQINILGAFNKKPQMSILTKEESQFLEKCYADNCSCYGDYICVMHRIKPIIDRLVAENEELRGKVVRTQEFYEGERLIQLTTNVKLQDKLTALIEAAGPIVPFIEVELQKLQYVRDEITETHKQNLRNFNKAVKEAKDGK